MKKIVFTCLSLAVVPTGSHADTIPRYDPVRWCEAVASAGGGSSEMIKQGCMEQEQDSYDGLKDQWQNIPVKARTWCDEVARSGGKGSYMILAGCIEQEVESGARNSTTQFKF